MFRLLVVLLLAMVGAVQYRLWVSDDGLAAVKRLETKVAWQQAENRRLRSRNDRLEAEVRDLKAGLEAIEERARRELGMVAEDETFYQFVAPPGAHGNLTSPPGAHSSLTSPPGAHGSSTLPPGADPGPLPPGPGSIDQAATAR